MLMWIVECVVLCIIFTLLIIPAQIKDPFSQIASYPPEIRERVKSLPQYANCVYKNRVKGNVVKKAAVATLICPIFGALAYFAGYHDFISAFLYVFTMFAFLNLYDLFVLDLFWFCHSKRVRIPGTENMDKEYRNPWHHVVGAAKGLAIGTAVSLIAAAFVSLLATMGVGA